MSRDEHTERSDSRRKHLPWVYWPIVFGVLLVWMSVGLLLFVALGFNPYIGAAVGGGAFTLLETWHTARRGYRI